MLLNNAWCNGEAKSVSYARSSPKVISIFMPYPYYSMEVLFSFIVVPIRRGSSYSKHFRAGNRIGRDNLEPLLSEKKKHEKIQAGKNERRYFKIAKINVNELTKEQIEKAMACDCRRRLLLLSERC